MSSRLLSLVVREKNTIKTPLYLVLYTFLQACFVSLRRVRVNYSEKQFVTPSVLQTEVIVTSYIMKREQVCTCDGKEHHNSPK